MTRAIGRIAVEGCLTGVSVVAQSAAHWLYSCLEYSVNCGLLTDTGVIITFR